jgi:putative membrane protein
MRWIWIGIFLGVLVWSGVAPKDYVTLGGIVLWFTKERFPLTTLTYVLILCHCIILMVGGHYTYAEVPAGEWMRELMDGSRNNYDKLGHFAQGFIPAIITRELMIRLNIFNSARWRDFFIICFCLGLSALYEIIEWWVALLSDEAAEAFLGTQGYVWDTQSDMGWALFGAIFALLFLSRWHDRQLRERGFVRRV